MTEQPIRLTGPADLAAAIPHLFGYQPTESIVMLCLTGPNRRFACGACTPLPALTGLDVNTEVAALIPTLRSAVRNSHADAVILALITETPDHYTDLALTLATVLHGTATTVQEVISITSTTIGNYRTPTDTQHRTGRHPGADTLAQTNALHGRTVLPHRDDYDHAINPDNGHTITEQQLTDALTDANRTLRTDPAALTTRAEQLYHHAITLAEHGHTLPDDHTADLTAALTTSLVTRDHITTLAIRAATTDQAAVRCPGSGGGSDLPRRIEPCLHPASTTRRPATGR